MKLYLLRHGEAADHNDPRFENDGDRPLTIKGAQRTKQLAHALRQWEITFDTILSSPLVRARETAEIVARGLKLNGRLELCDQLAPSGDVEKLLNQINTLRRGVAVHTRACPNVQNLMYQAERRIAVEWGRRGY